MIGVDKLVLTTTDYSVKDWGKLEHTPRKGQGKEPYTPDSRDILLYDKSGDPCFHKNLYYNPDPNNKSGKSRLNLTIDNRGLQVILNPSKYESDIREHIYPVHDHKTIMWRLDSYFEFMHHDLGIDFDSNGMKINRIDMCRNVESDKPVSAYKPMFETISLARTKNQTMYPEGFTDTNSQKGLIIYDKIKAMIQDNEIRKDKNLCNDLLKYPHLMRIEVQAKKQGVNNYFGLNRLSEIDSYGLPYLQDKYRHFLINNVFKNQPRETPVLPYACTLELLRDFKFSELIKTFGIESLIQSFGGVQQLLDSVNEIHGKMKKSRVRKQIISLIEARGMISDRIIEHGTISRMYQELHFKAVA
jgi:hypothetical protein